MGGRRPRRVGTFEPTPLRTGALSQLLRPLGQTVLPGLRSLAGNFASSCLGVFLFTHPAIYVNAKYNDKTGCCFEAQANAHAGSRARVTRMGGLYDAATLRALMAPSGCSTSKKL